MKRFLIFAGVGLSVFIAYLVLNRKKPSGQIDSEVTPPKQSYNPTKDNKTPEPANDNETPEAAFLRADGVVDSGGNITRFGWFWKLDKVINSIQRPDANLYSDDGKPFSKSVVDRLKTTNRIDRTGKPPLVGTELSTIYWRDSKNLISKGARFLKGNGSYNLI